MDMTFEEMKSSGAKGSADQMAAVTSWKTRSCHPFLSSSSWPEAGGKSRETFHMRNRMWFYYHSVKMFGQAAFDQKPSSKLASGRHLNHSCTGKKVLVI